MTLTTSPDVMFIFNNYPDHIKPHMAELRSLVLEAASEIEGLEDLEETLKWGEPSYLTKYGSTVRMDWKARKPGQYAIYFKCTSRLVPTFREIYGDELKFEGNRAIVFDIGEEIPKQIVKHCVSLALNYHRLKKLPYLGVSNKGDLRLLS